MLTGLLVGYPLGFISGVLFAAVYSIWRVVQALNKRKSGRV